ncbi:MAG: phage major capsid protein [Azospirillum sp.]|nr:phage major capsid protein [Azospirillum sp.]
MLEIKATASTVEFRGYASAFGPPPDQVGDQVAKGAFARSLAAGLPEMRREHRGIVGEFKAAVEDDLGLRVEGMVTDPATVADVRAGKLDGLSIGFITTKASRGADGVRTLEDVELKEISLVRRPAKSSARVLSVKGEDMENLETKDAPPADETADVAKEVKSALAGIEAKVGDIGKTVTGLSDRLGKVEVTLKRPGAAGAGNGETETKALEKKAFERFLRTGTEGMDQVERKALRIGDDEQAGYLAPPEFVSEIDKNLTLFSPIRSVATVRNTSRSEVNTLRRTSPATAVWTGEDDDRTETTVKYGQQSFPVRELATFVDVSLSLLEDAAVDVAAELASEFAEAFGVAEGTAFVNGDGVLCPLGFMNNTELSYTPGGDASNVIAGGLIDIFHAVKPAYRQSGVWVMNSTTLGKVRKLQDPSTGTYLLMTSGIGNAPVTSLLGRPVIEAPDMPDVSGNAFPIAFGDFGIGFRIYDRIALSIVRDDFTQRTKGRVRFHGRRRLAAGVRRPEAVRKLKIATS